MIEAQGYVIDTDGTLLLPEHVSPKMAVPSDLVPYCPKCKEPMGMNLRADHTFVEDSGWHKAAERYEDFIRRHKGQRILYLELADDIRKP